MGKEKRSRLHLSRTSPLASKEVELEEELVHEDFFDDVLTKLKGNPSDKILGANLLANAITSSADYSKTFNESQMKNLIRSLSPLSCDRVENVRRATVDALYQLSDVSDSLCDLIVDCDVLTPLASLLQKYKDMSWTADSKSEAVNEIFVNMCQLMANLCDVSTKAVRLLTHEDCINIMINSLKCSSSCSLPALAAAQFLCVLTDDNVIPQLLSQESVSLLQELLKDYSNSPQNLHLANLTAFILMNLNIKLEPEITAMIFDLIDATLSEPCQDQLNQLAQVIQNHLDDGKCLDELKETHENVQQILSAKRVALEFLTNITCCEEDELEMDCDENGDSHDEEFDNYSENGLEEVPNSCISPEHEQIVLEKSIFSKVNFHLSDIDDNLTETLKKHTLGKDILIIINTIQKRTLICIHNFVSCLSRDRISINDTLVDEIFNVLNSKDKLLTEEVTEAIRAILASSLLTLNVDRLEKLCQLCSEKDSSARFKVNVVKVMGLCAERTSDLEFLEKVTLMLLNALTNESDLMVKAEIFDSLIDIYSEDGKTDSLIKKLALISKLKDAEKVFRQEIKSKKLTKDTIISTIQLNLRRFIKYKEKMLK